MPAPALSMADVEAVKSTVAIAATGLLAADVALRRAGRTAVLRRTRGAALGLLAALAALCWWNLGRFHYPGFGHLSDTFHYYAGAKYFRELGYTRLYLCTAIADAEAGPATRVADRTMRDLETNRLLRTDDALADPDRCKRHFTPERWQGFRRDVAWFRAQVPLRRWHRVKLDHGYNGTPVWTAIGGALASLGPASDGRVLALWLLDPLLLAALFACVAWAAGPVGVCVGLVYWGTNHPAPFGWTGGGFLRQTWLFASVAGLCLLRRRHPVAGGFALATAALLRIFPGLLLVPVALQAGARMVRDRRVAVSSEHRRIAAGAALAAALWLPLAALATGGPGTWLAFARNARLHLDTPLQNHVGLRTVLAYSPEGRARIAADPALADPVAPWREKRRATFAAREPLYWALLAAFVALLARASLRLETWAAAVTGIGLVPVATELTGYYSSILAGYALLADRERGIGAALCGLSVVGWILADTLHFTDEILTGTSLAMVVFSFGVTAALAFRRARSGASSGRPPGATSG